MALSAPVPLAEHHDLNLFDCGEPSLNDWLRRRALPNQSSGASRTFVACDGDLVVGYYALASGAVHVAETPGKFRRNMPDPIPVVLLGRLAVDKNWKGRSIGRSLLQDACWRVVQAAAIIGVRGIAVQALNEDARNFYLALGFTPCLTDPFLLVALLKDLALVER